MLRTLSNTNEDTISKNIYRWIKKGELIPLKNGLYTTKTNFDRNISKPGYVELIANTLRTPSYVSLEYALSTYNIIPEEILAITSITTKCGRKYKNAIGNFVYKSISPRLFTNYETRKFDNHNYFFATKAKAVFDFIYFKSSSIPDLSEFGNFAKELRLDLSNFSKKDFTQLFKLFEKSKSKNLINLFDAIKNYASY